MSLADEAGLAAAAQALAAGEPVLVPTETVYGIAARIDRPTAIAALLRAKGRPDGKPLQVLVDGVESALDLALEPPPAARRLAEAFWPGPLTLVVAALSGIPIEVVAGDGSIGLRCPDHADLRRLLARTGPLAASSANLAGEPPATDYGAAVAALGASVGVAADGGPCRGGVPSTVVRVRPDGAEVLRQGALSAGAIEQVAGATP